LVSTKQRAENLCSGQVVATGMDSTLQQCWSLVDHTSPTWALLDIRTNAITQMFGDQQNKLGYCRRTVMVEVAKPIIMADVVHQGLQGSYFWIRYLFFQKQ